MLVGRCWEAGGAPAYWPWLQALRDYLREVDPEALRSELGAGAAVVAQLLPELGEVFPDLPEPPALEAESARFRLFEAVASFLESAAVQRPLVLFLDDLHAADEPSLLLLQFLARELAESRLLVVGAYRDVDPTPAHPLTTAVAELAREPVTRGLALAGLGEDEVARYIDLTTGEAADEELVADIYEETEGNPLFVGEIVRLLATEGSLQAGAARIAIPQSVRDVIARRLSHLSHECNRTLVLASVLGREFNLAALTQLTSVSEDELLDTLDEAMEARVVSDAPAGPGQLRFAHVLIRDALYEGLTTARRVRLHRQAVEALEALYGEEPGAHLAELAHHAIAGSDFQRGFDYVRRAGHRALDLLAYEEAARLYATALETAELTRVSDDVRCDLLLSLAESESRAGSASAAKEAFLEAADLARRLDLPRELALAAAGYGGQIVWARAADDPRLVPLLEEGLSVLGDEDKDLRARLLARLAGGALRDEPARERRDALSREAVELARAGSPATLAYALSGRAAAIIAPDTLSERLKLGTELCALGGRIADREPTVEGHYHRLIAYLELGEVTSAQRELEAMSNLASDLRQPAQLWQVCGIRAMIALAEGRITDAKEFISQALTYGESAQQDAAIAAYRLHLLMLSDFEGRLDAEERPLSDAAREHPARPVFRCALAYLHAQLGAKAEAERALSNLARDDFSSLPFDFEWLYGASLLAETCATVGEAASASVLHRLLEPYAERNVVDAPEGMRGAVARYLGLLAATLQRWDDAARHFENAIAMNERMGARPWLAHTQSDYARTLLARNNADDRARAHDLLDAAYATYRELGMESHAARSSTLRQKLSTVA